MSDSISPPPGFSLVQPEAPTPPPGFQLATPPEKPSIGKDVARGTGRGLIEGSGMVLGIPGDILQMLHRGFLWAVTKGAQATDLLTPEQAAAFRQQASDEQSTISSEVINRHLMNAAKSMGVDTTPPVGAPGKYAETIASFLPGAAASALFLPSAGALGATSAKDILAAMVKYGAIPGALSEGAGQATEGTALEPYARVAGALAPALPGAAIAALDRLANPMGRALQSAAPGQLDQAQTLLDQSRTAGAPLTVPEAIQQSTGSATPLGDLQRVVEQSPKGGAIMKPFFAERPEQTQALGQAALDKIATAPANPYEVAPQVQQAAQGVVNQADAARTAEVKPLYAAAAKDTVPAEDMENFLGKIDTMIAQDKTGLLSPQLIKLRDSLTEVPAAKGQPRVPITDIENLDNARKFFRDQIAQPAIAQDAVPKQVSAKIGGLLGDLNGMMETASTDFAAGKQRYQQISQETVDPLLRSPTGQLAAAEGFPKQAQILFNSNPLPGSQMAVGQAVQDVAKANPDAAQQLVRMYLEKTFNEATQNNLPGANQFGGPKFVAVVAGNSQQAKNLEAAVRALPDGGTRWAALRKSMDIMEAMGTRQPVGSQTAFNAQIMQFLKQGHPGAEALATAASPGRWTTVAHDLYQKFAYGQNTAAMARVFTEGGVKDLRAIVDSSAKSMRAQAALAGLVTKYAPLYGQNTDQQ